MMKCAWPLKGDSEFGNEERGSEWFTFTKREIKNEIIICYLNWKGGRWEAVYLKF